MQYNLLYSSLLIQMLITSKKLRTDAEAEAPILWPPDVKS